MRLEESDKRVKGGMKTSALQPPTSYAGKGSAPAGKQDGLDFRKKFISQD